jgi:serine/threonine protein kinase
MDKYIKEGEVGEGTYGVVFRAKVKATGETVAIKRIRISGSGEGVDFTALREIKMLQELHHPNVVEVCGGK